MKLLLDTNVLIWFATGQLSPARESSKLIQDGANELLVSAASAWEIATKFRLGKLPQGKALAADFDGVLAGHDLTPLPITSRHARLAGMLPGEHGDPFDRMMAAQALLEDAVVLSTDPEIEAFGARRIW